jgi:hypothetical protein
LSVVSVELFQLAAPILIGVAGGIAILVFRWESAALDRRFGADPS